MNKIQILPMSSDATIPTRASDNSAGLDLYASKTTVIEAYNRNLIDTNLKLEMVGGTFGMITGRSGIAWNHGIQIHTGIIDSDYRGELKILAYNTDKNNYVVWKGDRVGQLIILSHEKPEIRIVNTVNETSRGAHGFGSSGK